MIRVDNPASGDIVAEVPLMAVGDLEGVVARAMGAQREWADTPLALRLAAVERFLAYFVENREDVAREITLQMGKPVAQARGEVGGMAERARFMASIAAGVLAPERLPEKPGFERWIAREPVGLVVIIAPWNYPLLTVVNTLVPAVLAGNAVVLKHSPRTPLTGDRFEAAFAAAGVPEGLVQSVHADHTTAAWLLQHPETGFVAFTGSVRGGGEVYRTAAERRFIDVGLELGGKDAAYVCEDADLAFTVENVIDGGFYNAGQSCCAVERVYVARPLFDRFVEAAVELVRTYRMGDPLRDDVTLGPLALPSAPPVLQAQVADARSKGATILTGGGATTAAGPGRFFEPTLLVDVHHDMAIMRDESFGPVLGIMMVEGDDDALRLMEDSEYGLTASIWTRDAHRAERLGQRLRVGTVFMNRCDYLDPALPWTGVKLSGKGHSLSRHGFDSLTRLKSYHFRLPG